MQDFNMNPYMQQFLDLDDAARFYRQTFDLWERYCGMLGLDVHTVHYEDLVSDFRPNVAGILNFLGVAWNDAVFEHDRTALTNTRIHTPSYHQVAEKIYARASGRWLRYRSQMETVIPILAPYAEKFGYTMDDGSVPTQEGG
jgi:hypothetical protein